MGCIRKIQLVRVRGVPVRDPDAEEQGEVQARGLRLISIEMLAGGALPISLRALP